MSVLPVVNINNWILYTGFPAIRGGHVPEKFSPTIIKTFKFSLKKAKIPWNSIAIFPEKGSLE